MRGLGPRDRIIAYYPHQRQLRCMQNAIACKMQISLKEFLLCPSFARGY